MVTVDPVPDELSLVPWPRRFIFVHGRGSLGDALQMSPLFPALRQRFPGRSIVVAHPSPAAAQAYGVPGLVDLLITSHASRMQMRLLNFLPQTGCELIVHWRYAVDYFPTARLLAAQERDFVETARARQTAWTQVYSQDLGAHALLWRRALDAGLNMYRLAAHTAGMEDVDFETLVVARAPDAAVRALGLPPRYLVVGNGAQALHAALFQCTKTLPHPKMQALVHALRPLGLPLVHLGESRDEPPLHGVDHDLRGRTTVAEAAAVLAGAASFVVPESGLSNLARAAGARGVVFFGSTPPEFFGFRHNVNIAPSACGGCWWTTPSYLTQCPRLMREPECLSSIPLDAVVSAVARQVAA
jgi:ADP-heptose:LPS heptosyltransferase